MDGLQGKFWKALGLDRHPQSRSHHHGYQCHHELLLTLETYEWLCLSFFKSTKPYVRPDCAAKRPLIPFILTHSGRKRELQESPDGQSESPALPGVQSDSGSGHVLRALPDGEQQGVEGGQGAVKAHTRHTPVF